MAREVYASVVWALVGATIASPLLFRWALGVYGRATPVVRSRSITAARFDPADLEAAALVQSADGSSSSTAAAASTLQSASGKSFRIRIGARHHIGVQREILGCLHASDVDVLEQHVHAVNHPSTDSVDAFVASYVRRQQRRQQQRGGGGGSSGSSSALLSSCPSSALVYSFSSPLMPLLSHLLLLHPPLQGTSSSRAARRRISTTRSSRRCSTRSLRSSTIQTHRSSSSHM